MSMYNKLGTVEGYLQDAQSEVYFTTIRDRWWVPPVAAGRHRAPRVVLLKRGIP